MTSLRTCTGRSRTGCNGVGVHKSHKSREHSITRVFFFHSYLCASIGSLQGTSHVESVESMSGDWFGYLNRHSESFLKSTASCGAHLREIERGRRPRVRVGEG